MRFVIFLLLLCTGISHADYLPCSSQQPELLPGQVSGSGSNPVEAVAIQRAQEAVARQVDAAMVSTQFIQQLNQRQADSAVVRQQHSSVQQQVQLDATRATYYKKQCNGSYHVLLIYDTESLSTRVAQQLNVHMLKPRGPSYLIHSRLLRPYQDNDGPSVSVRLSAGPQQLFLHVGEIRYEIKLTDLDDIIAWPSLANSFFSISNDSLSPGSAQAIATAPQQPMLLFVCGERFACSWLQRVDASFQQGNIIALFSGKHTPSYLVAVAEDVLQQYPQLMRDTASPSFFLFALEQLDQIEATSYWHSVNVPGKF